MGRAAAGLCIGRIIGVAIIPPMELFMMLVDFVLHVDRHLRVFVENHGAWVYLLLFVIIFVETGLVVMPFLPGDSLLFVVGALAGLGLMSYPLAVLLMTVAAVAGNQTNYTIGRAIGPKVFQWEHSRWFNKRAFDKAHAFYERYGGITIVLARFMPFLRTFAPFVAGVAQMTRSKFTFYDVTGGTLWVASLVTLGYLFGNMPWVQDNLSKIIWAMIIIPGLIVGFGALKARSNEAKQAAASGG
jgi:membrane-associated protein